MSGSSPPRAPLATSLSTEDLLRIWQGKQGKLATVKLLLDMLQPGPRGVAGPSAYDVAVAAGYTGTQAQWLASLRGDPGAPVRVEVVTGTSGSNGTGTLTFPKAFTAPPVLVPKITWAGAQMVVGDATNITAAGAAITVMRSRGTLLLNTGPFEAAPNTTAAFVAFGR